jgi:integrase
MKVQPIRSIKKIKAMHNILKGSDKSGRDALLFMVGIQTAYRITDIINLRYSDIFHEGHRFREYVRTREKKTRKWKQFKLPENLRNDIKKYVRKHNLEGDDFIFFSHRTKGNNIERTRAYTILTQAAKIVHISNFGTHSLRKTFGYHYYQQTKDIATLMKVFNHASQDKTLMYLGIEQESIDKVYTEVENIYKL